MKACLWLLSANVLPQARLTEHIRGQHSDGEYKVRAFCFGPSSVRSSAGQCSICGSEHNYRILSIACETRCRCVLGLAPSRLLPLCTETNCPLPCHTWHRLPQSRCPRTWQMVTLSATVLHRKREEGLEIWLMLFGRPIDGTYPLAVVSSWTLEVLCNRWVATATNHHPIIRVPQQQSLCPCFLFVLVKHCFVHAQRRMRFPFANRPCLEPASCKRHNALA